MMAMVNVVRTTLRVSWVHLAMTSLIFAQSVDHLTPHRVKLESVEYLGKRAVRVTEEGSVPNGEAYAVVTDSAFHNGAIELELAGRPVANASDAARGFIGIAFRLQGDKFEYVYLRPTNGRADDQIRRNHSTQYSAHPDFSFAVARQQAPEKYESYVDLEPGVWTRFRITVEGATARLFVHGAAQPCLIVNDLKLGDSTGGVALWIGPGTEGYFANLSIRQQSEQASVAIDNLIKKLHEDHKFNGEILVAKQGKVIYRRAYGVANPESGHVFTPDTPSCLASLSKPLTALAIMRLTEKRRLAYDDRIAKYFPTLPPALGSATIRQLLNHTSGIPDYDSELNIEHPGMTNAEVLSGLRQVAPLFPPGEKYHYSNTGYVLLGLIVEQLTGVSLSKTLQDDIFRPLGMKDTFVLTSAAQKTGAVARGYDAFGRADDFPGYITGDSGVYSTVDDLFLLDQALYTEQLVSQKTLDEAFKPGHVREGSTTYGLGWNAASDASGMRVWHTGNTAGFRAFIERRLDQKITVIMLTNGGDTNRVEINEAIQRILDGTSHVLPE
jgi:CubicO group peptidase (beta-lactamase class C family)